MYRGVWMPSLSPDLHHLVRKNRIKNTMFNTPGTGVDVPIGICCNGSKPPFEGGSLGSNPSVPVKNFYTS